MLLALLLLLPLLLLACCAAAGGGAFRALPQRGQQAKAPRWLPAAAFRLLQAMKAAAEVMEDPSKLEQYRSVDPKLYTYLQALLGLRG